VTGGNRTIGKADLKKAVKRVADIERRASEKEGRAPQTQFVVIGRGALVATKASDKLRMTEDVDLVVKNWGVREQVSKILGAKSKFRETNGFYVQGIDDFAVMKLNDGWQNRAQEVPIGDGVSAHLLAPIDLASAKLRLGETANRPKDIDHVGGMIDEGLVNPKELLWVVGASQEEAVRERRAHNLGIVLRNQGGGLNDEVSKNLRLIADAHGDGILTKHDAHTITWRTIGADGLPEIGHEEIRKSIENLFLKTQSDSLKANADEIAKLAQGQRNGMLMTQRLTTLIGDNQPFEHARTTAMTITGANRLDPGGKATMRVEVERLLQGRTTVESVVAKAKALHQAATQAQSQTNGRRR